MTNLLIISHSNNNWPTPEKNSSAIMLMVFPFISRFSLHFVLFWPMVRNSVSWCFIFNWLPNFHNISYLYWSVNPLQEKDIFFWKYKIEKFICEMSIGWIINLWKEYWVNYVKGQICTFQLWNLSKVDLRVLDWVKHDGRIM